MSARGCPSRCVETETDEVDDVTLPLMMALERLSPLERAAFLLHDVFGVDFDEVAKTIGTRPGRVPPARQPRPQPCPRRRARASTFRRSKGCEIAEAFFTASRNGDMAALRALLAEDVALHADGGGKQPAALEPVVGLDDVMKLQTALARCSPPTVAARALRLDQRPAGLRHVERRRHAADDRARIEDGQIVAIYIMRNPDKLGQVGRVTGLN